MSAEQQAKAAALKAIVHELEIAIPGLTATKYLSVSGLVILLYDHLLLFGEETRLIWSAKWSWSKGLFLFNRYTVPLCLFVTMHQLSGLSAAGLSNEFCKTWLATVSFLCILTLAVANVFVVQRVYALWGRSRRILFVLVPVFVTVYILTIISAVFAVRDMLLKTCILTKKPKLFIAAYAVPIFFDIFLFSLTCWNAFDRPRHMQTAVVKQLYTDGVVYFVALLSLRVFNILVLAAADIAYLQLGVYFIWSMIACLINRMLITISTTVEHPQSIDPSGRYTSSQQQAPFELGEMISTDEGYASFMDMTYDPRAENLPVRPPAPPPREFLAL